MKNFKPILGVLILGACSAGFSASAQQTQPASRGAMTDDAVDNRYQADKERCDAMQGNAKDVCQKEAEARRDSAKADARQSKENAEARRDATKEKTDAQYDVEKAKCDALSGDAKDQCQANAKARYGK